MDDDLDDFDKIVEDLGLGDGADDLEETGSDGKDTTTSQQDASTAQVMESLQKVLAEFDEPALTEFVADLCRACGWTTEVIDNESASRSAILARKYLPHPASVRVVTHTASRVTADSVTRLLTDASASTASKQTILVSEPPTDSAIETIQDTTVELIDLTDLARDIFTRGLTELVVQHASWDEQLSADPDVLESLEVAGSQSTAKETTGSEQGGDPGGKTDSTQVSVAGEGDYLDIEVVGFDNKMVEFEDRDAEILEEREYTVICMHVKNKTSHEWEFRGYKNLAVTSADGFSYDNPQSNGWSSRTGQFTPWNNGKRHEIKPNSKVRAVVIYKTWFEPQRIEYSADLLHVHGDDDLKDGTERISIEIDEAARGGLRSLPDSIPIDSVVLN